MKKYTFIFILLCFSNLSSAQQNRWTAGNDGFINIITDARAAGQGDVGVATSVDAFSQYWNPSKYVFSSKKTEIGITRILGNKEEFMEFEQLNFNFYNKLSDRNAYGFSFRGYGYRINQFKNAYEIAIDGSYTLRLSHQFAMSVVGRFISLGGKAPQVNSSNDAFDNTLYGIDVSGFYYGKESAYKKYNGRWRGGFNFSNLRGKSLRNNKEIESYAPSIFNVGLGFDLIFDSANMLAITTAYKMPLDLYGTDTSNQELNYEIHESTTIALGLEYVYQEKFYIRMGYSHGIDKKKNSFFSLGMGLYGKYVDTNLAYIPSAQKEKDPIRSKVRLSLSLDLAEIL